MRVLSRKKIWLGLAALSILGVFAAGASLAFQGRLAGGETPGRNPASAKPGSPAAGATPSSVTLTGERRAAAHMTTAKVLSVELPVEVVVPGRIEANADRRIDIRPRATGVVRSVQVQIGQRVKAGETLVTLESPDVGTARLNLRNRQRDLAIARTEAEWKSTIAANIEQLIPELRKNTPTETIEKEFAAKPLGTDRGLLLSAYAEWQIASHEEEKQADLFKKEIVGEHSVYVSKHTREGAQAKFEAALEQIRYDAKREQRLADQQVRVAAANVIDAAQRLRLLGVAVDLAETIDHAERALNNAQTADYDDITAYPIVAPFEGTIIARSAVPSQRAELADALFTLADLRRVRVQANVPESDFALLPKLNSSTVRVSATAYPERAFEAAVLAVGAIVDPTTRTVPLLAEMDNPDGLLKLGLFVRVTLDSSKSERALTVPDKAVVEIEGKPGVFLPDRDGKTYHFRAVTLGRELNGRQAIASGLAEGDRVVSDGAFTLKSELILQNAREEE
jgi:RND family efflux transporter MFP subunit